MAKDKFGNVKFPNYFKNVAKSVAYTTHDLIKSEVPALDEYSSTNSELTRATIDSLKNINRTVNVVKRKIDSAPVTKDVKDILKNAVSDAATGKFYNKQRLDSADVFGLGGDWGDMDEWDDNFDKMDFGETKSSKTSKSSKGKGGEVTNTVNVTNNVMKSASFEKQAGLQVSLTKAQIANQDKNNQFANILSTKHHEEAMHERKNINENLGKMVTFSTDAIGPVLEKTLRFYDESITEQRKQVALLHELSDMQKQMLSGPRQEERKESDVDKVLGANGVLNFSEYGKLIGRNTKTYIENQMGMSLDFLKGMGGNPLKEIAASPWTFAVKTISRKMLPDIFKNAVSEFNKTIESFGTAFLAKMNSWKRDDDNQLKKIVGNMLGIDTKSKRNIDIGMYEKGAIPFDGVTKKAITDVIPSLLSKIYSGLMGFKDEIVVDYEKGGTFHWKSEKEKELQSQKDLAGMTELSDFNDKLSERLSAFNFSDKEEEKQFMEGIESAKRFVRDLGFFNPKNEQDMQSLRVATRGNHRDVADFFAATLNSLSPEDQLAFQKQVFKADQEASKYTRFLESGSAMNGYAQTQMSGSLGVSKLDSTQRDVNTANDKREKSMFKLVDGIRRLLVQGIIVYPHLKGGKGKGKGNMVASPEASQWLSERLNEERDIIAEEKAKRKERERRRAEEQSKKEKDAKRAEEDSRKKGLTTFNSEAFGQRENLQQRTKYITDSLAVQDANDRKHKRGKYAEKESIFGDFFEGSNNFFQKLHSIYERPFKFASKFLGSIDHKFYEVIYGKDEANKDHKKGLVGEIANSIKDRVTSIGQTFKSAVMDKVVDKMFDSEKGIPAYFKRSWQDGFLKPVREGTERTMDSLFGIKDTDGKRRGGLFTPIRDEVVGTFAHVGSFFTGGEYKDANGKTIKNDNSVAKNIKEQFGSITRGLSDFLFGKGVRDEKTGTLVWRESGGVVTNLVNSLSGAFGSFQTQLFGKDKSGKEFAQKFKEYLPAGVAGSALGLIGSFFLPGGPVLGMALGAGINIARKTGNLDRILFGKVDDDGKTHRGIFANHMKEKFKSYGLTMDNAPKLAASAALGVVGSMFLPGGPLVGAMVGSGLSLVSNSETLKESLFGKKGGDGKRLGGLISKEWVDRFPTLKVGAAGAGIGLLGSIFLPGGPLLGAGVGALGTIVANSEELKIKLFGKKTGPNGERIGGMFDKEFRAKFGRMSVGAGAGYLTSMFLPGGPLVGAIMAGAGAYITRNKSLMDAVFGEKDENGKRQGALISKAFQDKFPKIAIGAGIGAAALPFLPGGPLVGALVGGTLARSEGFNNMIFGKKDLEGNRQGGLIRKVFKSAFPKMVIGGTLGAMALPFLPGGPVIGAVVGTVTGALMHKGRLKKFLWGDYDKETGTGKRGVMRKLFSNIRNSVLGPLGNMLQRTLIEPVRHNLTKFVVNPLASAFKPLMTELGFQIKVLAKTAGQWLGKPFKAMGGWFKGVFNKAMGSPFAKMIKEQVIDRFAGWFKKIFQAKFFQNIGNVFKNGITGGLQNFKQAMDANTTKLLTKQAARGDTRAAERLERMARRDVKEDKRHEAKVEKLGKKRDKYAKNRDANRKASMEEHITSKAFKGANKDVQKAVLNDDRVKKAAWTPQHEQDLFNRMVNGEISLEDGAKLARQGKLKHQKQLEKVTKEFNKKGAQKATNEIMRNREFNSQFSHLANEYKSGRISEMEYKEKVKILKKKVKDAYKAVEADSKDLFGVEKKRKKNAILDAKVDVHPSEGKEYKKVKGSDGENYRVQGTNDNVTKPVDNSEWKKKNEELVKKNNERSEYLKSKWGKEGGEVGKDVVQGAISGIKSNEKELQETVKEMVNSSIIKETKDELEIKSPSRVMMRLAKFVVEGLSGGLRKNKGEVAEAMDEVVGEATGGAKQGFMSKITGLFKGKGKGGKGGNVKHDQKPELIGNDHREQAKKAKEKEQHNALLSMSKNMADTAKHTSILNGFKGLFDKKKGILGILAGIGTFLFGLPKKIKKTIGTFKKIIKGTGKILKGIGKGIVAIGKGIGKLVSWGSKWGAKVLGLIARLLGFSTAADALGDYADGKDRKGKDKTKTKTRNKKPKGKVANALSKLNPFKKGKTAVKAATTVAAATTASKVMTNANKTKNATKAATNATEAVTKNATKTAGKGVVKGIAKGAAKFIPGLGLVMAGADAVGGWNRAEEEFGLEEGQKATFGQKMSSATGGLVSGLTFGLVDSGKASNFIHNTGSAIGKGVGKAKDWVVDGAGKIADGAKNLFSKGKDFLGDMFGKTKDAVKGGAEKLKEFSKDAINKGKDVAKNVIDGVTGLSKKITDSFSNSKVGKTIKGLGENVGKFVGGLGEKLGELGGAVSDKVGEITDSVSDAVGNGVDYVKDKSKNAFTKLSDWGKNAWKRLTGKGGPALDPEEVTDKAAKKAIEGAFGKGGPVQQESLMDTGGGSSSTEKASQFAMPVTNATLTSKFGMRSDPFTGEQTGHGGVDWGVPTGTDVMASADGKVIRAEYSNSYGNVIYLDHGNGITSRYAHNSQLLVKNGDTVKQGQVIAKSGSTGRSTGPHVHFEILKNGQRVDPLPYVEGNANVSLGAVGSAMAGAGAGSVDGGDDPIGTLLSETGNFFTSLILGKTYTPGSTGASSTASASSSDAVIKNLSGNNNVQKAWNFFKQKGFSDEATAGVLGNLQQESGIDPTKKQYGGGPGRGLAQWEEGGRWNSLTKWADGQGLDKWSMEAQLGYLWEELNGKDPTTVSILNKRYGGMDKLKTMGYRDAVVAFEDSFERAGKPNYPNRYKYAEQILNQYKGSFSNATASRLTSSGATQLMGGPQVPVSEVLRGMELTRQDESRQQIEASMSNYHTDVTEKIQKTMDAEYLARGSAQDVPWDTIIGLLEKISNSNDVIADSTTKVANEGVNVTNAEEISNIKVDQTSNNNLNQGVQTNRSGGNNIFLGKVEEQRQKVSNSLRNQARRIASGN
jgi:murein DD-endopeptidase MepM/ murein hydrolase activator NlpD